MDIKYADSKKIMIKKPLNTERLIRQQIIQLIKLYLWIYGVIKIW